MANIRRRISFTKGLQDELDARVHRANDLVADATTIDGSAAFDDKYVGANAFKTANDLNVKTANIVDDLVTGGTQVPLSAEQGKVLKGFIDGMAGGLEYKGTWDASTGLPADVEIGYFYKISVAGTQGTLEMAVGDMIIANSDVVGATTDTNWDKIDNTEAADILRDGDVTTEADWALEGTKLSDRATTKTYVDDAVAAVSIKFINETVTIAADAATLTHSPANDVIFTGTASVNNGDGTFDIVECTCVGTALTLAPDAAGAYDGLSATVTYAYV
jgi:hypothetical protein